MKGELMSWLDASSGQGYSTSSGGSQNTSSAYGWSNTNGTEAIAQARASADYANQLALQNWQMQANYNSAEAQKQRDWLERMANTTYQRTVKDMIAAGINPILAASSGFGADAISSGATATATAPDTYMAPTFANSNSASGSQGQGSSWQNSYSYNMSVSGLSEAIQQMAELFGYNRDVTTSALHTATSNAWSNLSKIRNNLNKWNSPGDNTGLYNFQKNHKSQGGGTGKGF